jgi:hypothetical protein
LRNLAASAVSQA